MRKRFWTPVAWCGALVLAAGSLAGCAAVDRLAAPMCTSERLDPLILVTQSVPSASSVPCIASYPSGWSLGTVDVRRGRASFSLDSDRAGDGALRVRLEPSCDVSGATQVPSDKPGTERFERILSVDNGFRAVRTYRFGGGCISYHLRFRARAQALVNEASLAVGFVTRVHVAERVQRETDGSHL